MKEYIDASMAILRDWRIIAASFIFLGLLLVLRYVGVVYRRPARGRINRSFIMARAKSAAASPRASSVPAPSPAGPAAARFSKAVKSRQTEDEDEDEDEEYVE